MIWCLPWMAGVMVLLRQILPWDGFEGAAIALLAAAPPARLVRLTKRIACKGDSAAPMALPRTKDRSIATAAKLSCDSGQMRHNPV